MHLRPAPPAEDRAGALGHAAFRRGAGGRAASRVDYVAARRSRQYRHAVGRGGRAPWPGTGHPGIVATEPGEWRVLAGDARLGGGRRRRRSRSATTTASSATIGRFAALGRRAASSCGWSSSTARCGARTGLLMEGDAARRRCLELRCARIASRLPGCCAAAAAALRAGCDHAGGAWRWSTSASPAISAAWKASPGRSPHGRRGGAAPTSSPIACRASATTRTRWRRGEPSLFHALISTSLNIGLLSPRACCEAAEAA